MISQYSLTITNQNYPVLTITNHNYPSYKALKLIEIAPALVDQRL